MDKKISLFSTPRSERLAGRSGTKHSNLGINAGGAIVIIIFVVLCLTIFAILSFSASYADKKLSDKTRGEYVKLNQTEMLAEDMLSDVDTVLATAGVTLPADGIAKIREYYDKFDTAFSVVYESETAVFTWKIDDMHGLQVKVRVYTDAGTNALRYTVESWKSVITGELVYEKGLDVWQG